MNVVYELQCLNQDGYTESNGMYSTRAKAEKAKKERDNYPENKKYSIVQDIIMHEVN